MKPIANLSFVNDIWQLKFYPPKGRIKKNYNWKKCHYKSAALFYMS